MGLIIISVVLSLICSLLFGSAKLEANTVEALKEYLLHPTNLITAIWDLIIFIPGLAMTVRRLHDINKSGFWVFIELIPVVGSLILLIFTCLPAVKEGNNY